MKIKVVVVKNRFEAGAFPVFESTPLEVSLFDQTAFNVLGQLAVQMAEALFEQEGPLGPGLAARVSEINDRGREIRTLVEYQS